MHHHDHDCTHGCCQNKSRNTENIVLTQNERDFLHELSHRKYLPLASFVTKSSKTHSFEIIALQPVFIRSIGDTIEDVKECGEFLKILEEKGMISLDYDIELEGYDYNEYKNCELYEKYCEVVKEGSKRENYLGNIPTLQFGSISLCENS